MDWQDSNLAETVLVLGAGSGVGSAAIQIARLVGARVFTTVGSDEKFPKARELGADELINHTTEDVGRRVRDLTDGQGVNVVIEHIGQQVWDQCFKSLARGGRLVTCGATTGGEVTLDARFLFSRQLTVMGSYLGTRSELQKAGSLIEVGKLRPVVDCVLPLREARTAQELLINRGVFGKVVLSVNENAN